MKKFDKNSTPRYSLHLIFTSMGIGLIFMGLFEYFGMSGFRIVNRHPLGVKTWLIAGGGCLLVGYLIGKLRN